MLFIEKNRIYVTNIAKIKQNNVTSSYLKSNIILRFKLYSKGYSFLKLYKHIYFKINFYDIEKSNDIFLVF